MTVLISGERLVDEYIREACSFVVHTVSGPIAFFTPSTTLK